MARTWLCRCGHRNERVWLKCRGDNCGRARPKNRRPAHAHALDIAYDHYVDLNAEVHGVDELTCALCGGPRRGDIRLDRDHAHHDGGYARGLLHSMCNKRLGEVERGNDGEAWLEAALEYCRRSRLHHEAQEEAA
jgi:hypothetical protein